MLRFAIEIRLTFMGAKLEYRESSVFSRNSENGQSLTYTRVISTYLQLHLNEGLSSSVAYYTTAWHSVSYMPSAMG